MITISRLHHLCKKYKLHVQAGYHLVYQSTFINPRLAFKMHLNKKKVLYIMPIV